MKRRSTIRAMLALSFGLATAVIMVQPAAAFRPFQDTGSQGYDT